MQILSVIVSRLRKEALYVDRHLLVENFISIRRCPGCWTELNIYQTSGTVGPRFSHSLTFKPTDLLSILKYIAKMVNGTLQL